MSSLPRIEADPIGFENLQEQNNYFLSGEPYIKTSWRDNSAIQSVLNWAMLRIFFGSFLSNLFSAVTVTVATSTTIVEQLLTTTSTEFSPTVDTITASCIPTPYSLCAWVCVLTFILQYSNNRSGEKNVIISMLLLGLIYSSSE